MQGLGQELCKELTKRILVYVKDYNEKGDGAILDAWIAALDHYRMMERTVPLPFPCIACRGPKPEVLDVNIPCFAHYCTANRDEYLCASCTNNLISDHYHCDICKCNTCSNCVRDCRACAGWHCLKCSYSKRCEN